MAHSHKKVTKGSFVPSDKKEDDFNSHVPSSKTKIDRSTYSQRLKKPYKLSQEEYINGILAKNRTILAKAITLLESTTHTHQTLAQSIIQALMPHANQSIRIGITGVPGAGKSTFIDQFGSMLCKKGHKVAVLAIDPSSSISGGSILGDKTRMENLATNVNAFIRPSPSRGTLGGVANKTRESMFLCEAAGYNIILIETVGTGQSEIAVRSMVDFFLLLQITGAGDELQGIKKGVVELADAIVVTKADGKNRTQALVASNEYAQAVRYLQPATKGWTSPALCCSAHEKEGLDEIWDIIVKFREITQSSKQFFQRRSEQNLSWAHSMIEHRLKEAFYENPMIKEKISTFEDELINQKITITQAVNELINIHLGTINK